MTVYISPNPGKAMAYGISQRAAQILLTHGAQVLMQDGLQAECMTMGVVYLSQKECLERTDVILTIGGDGTILHEANLSLEYRKPILGINLGRCGFLATCEVDEMESKLSAVARGEYFLDNRMLLGFVTPVAAVFASLKAYLARAGQSGAFKLWLGGYSRGSIIANLLAAKIARELPQLGRENIYAYGFAVPAALTAADRPDLQQDFDANHAPDGTLLESWPESNIFSIISSGDAVARVLPAAWGYHRNGCDRFLPATRNAEELADLDALGAEFGPTPLVVSSLATAEDTSALIDIVAKFCVSRENFHQKYETAIMDMIQCAFIRSEKEVVDGYILSDGEIVERLQSLSHMKEIDYWQIVGSVWAASTMSRPILERYGQNVPLLARQILIPVLAVGLCYGIETDVVQMVAQYIIRLLTARGELDSVLRAAFCHHPENYISLMEYYTPEEHGMEPFTRK